MGVIYSNSLLIVWILCISLYLYMYTFLTRFVSFVNDHTGFERDSKITKYIETVTQDMTELQDTKQNKVLLR